MFRIVSAANGRRKALVAMLFLLCSAGALIPGTAHAYYSSEIGQVAPARVWCNAATNRVDVTPQVGTGTYWDSQYVAARFWVLNARSGKFMMVPAPGRKDGWNWFFHQRKTTIFINEMIGSSSTYTAYADASFSFSVLVDGIDVRATDWEFYIYTEYAWWTTTGMVTSTNSYKTVNYGDGGYSGMGLPYCRL